MSDFLTLEVRYGPCAAIRIRELEADLARVTAERDALLRDDALVAIKRNNDDLRECNDAHAAKLARCEDALNGMIGLIQLVASRDDLPTGLDDLMRLSHRMTEARAYFAEQEPRT